MGTCTSSTSVEPDEDKAPMSVDRWPGDNGSRATFSSPEQTTGSKFTLSRPAQSAFVSIPCKPGQGSRPPPQPSRLQRCPQPSHLQLERDARQRAALISAELEWRAGLARLQSEDSSSTVSREDCSPGASPTAESAPDSETSTHTSSSRSVQASTHTSSSRSRSVQAPFLRSPLAAPSRSLPARHGSCPPRAVSCRGALGSSPDLLADILLAPHRSGARPWPPSLPAQPGPATGHPQGRSPAFQVLSKSAGVSSSPSDREGRFCMPPVPRPAKTDDAPWSEGHGHPEHLVKVLPSLHCVKAAHKRLGRQGSQTKYETIV